LTDCQQGLNVDLDQLLRGQTVTQMDCWHGTTVGIDRLLAWKDCWHRWTVRMVKLLAWSGNWQDGLLALADCWHG